MIGAETPYVLVRLPAELAARMEELKKDRDGDRDKSVEELVREFCESYVEVREKARREAARSEELDRSYVERPNDYGDAEFWEEAYNRFVEEKER